MRKLKLTILALSLALILIIGMVPLIVNAAPVDAVVTAHSGQVITGTYNATNHDVGIYVPPGVKNVKIIGVTVHGARYEGILVQDASNVVIQDSELYDNGQQVGGGETKAIVLAGTKNCEVKNNNVHDNLTGGIAVIDDGPTQPFFVDGVAESNPTPGTGNKISGNTLTDNFGDCAIVVSGKNAGAGVAHNMVSGNKITGGIGGIILGAGFVGASSVIDTVILNNEVTFNNVVPPPGPPNSTPGIVLHCGNFVGDATISGTQIIGNVLSDNGWGDFSGDTTGIEIAALEIPNGHTATIDKTQVLHNTITGDNIPIFQAGDTGTHIVPK